MALRTLLVMGWVWAAAAWGSPLTLSEAVRRAAEQSPTLSAAKARLDGAELGASNALAVMFPSLDLSATHGYSADNPATTDTPYVSLTKIEITENLYDNGVSYTRYRQARLAEERAHTDYLLVRERLALDVSREFFRYSQATRLLEVERDQYDLLRKQSRLMEEQFRQGLKTREDYIRIKAQLQRAELSLLRAETDVEKSRRQLLRLLGVPLEGETEYAFASLEVTDLKMSDHPATAPSPTGTLAYRSNNLQRRIRDLDVTLAERRFWPQIDLKGSAGYEVGGYLGTGRGLRDGDRLAYGASLTLTFNLWDWGIRRRDVAIAEREKLAVDRELRAAELTDKAAIETLMVELDRSRRSYRLSRELLDLESANFRALEADYRRGIIRYLDLITGLQNLASARGALIGAYFDYRGALAEHRFYEGKLYEATAAP